MGYTHKHFEQGISEPIKLLKEKEFLIEYAMDCYRIDIIIEKP